MNETVRFMVEMAPRVVKHIHEEAPGDVFAQWIVDGYGVERVNTIRQATPEQIVMFYRTLPSWELTERPRRPVTSVLERVPRMET